MMYYAHSGRGEIPAQTYQEHIEKVIELGQHFLEAVAKYAVKDKEALTRTVRLALEFHDLGKLDEDNQIVLSGKKASSKLPVNHVDAGTAHLLQDDSFCLQAAVIIAAHHLGLPDFMTEVEKGVLGFRDQSIYKRTNKQLCELRALHNGLISPSIYNHKIDILGNSAVFYRLVLSCLADSDHTDTAQNYKRHPLHEPTVELRPKSRLQLLNKHVDDLKANNDAETERNKLRQAMYTSCRDQHVSESISSCDSPVGSGKTTAVMAHLLRQAELRGLRRIIVVLPFTNIIQQSVTIYRKALVFPDENPADVVAEIHHRADYQSKEARHLTALWRAPIIVTTAVAFFETLASNMPAGLRRLHQLPGSAIFVDESHAAVPVKLLPITWQWIQTFADEWSCYWVLASGSLNRFWHIPEIARTNESRHVPEIVDENLRRELSKYEINRISYCYKSIAMNTKDLAKWIHQHKGPRLVIMNTVQSAAMLAYEMGQKDRLSVEHLSTSLKPVDRDKTLSRVIKRLRNTEDNDWTLVATSCVEAGVDLSFKNGFREIGSLLSLLQASGRVNREGTYKTSCMWSFCIIEDGKLITNPGLKQSANILKSYLENDVEIKPELSTDSIIQELRLYSQMHQTANLPEHENMCSFKTIAHYYKVIDSNTKTVIVDEKLAQKLLFKQFDWRELQKNALQISAYKLDMYHAKHLIDNIYQWTLSYDDFLGYMAGVIELNRIQTSTLLA